MMKKTNSNISRSDSWVSLQNLTPARVALGRSGMSQRTATHLEFQLAHAKARDSVKLLVDFNQIEHDLNKEGHGPVIQLNTRAINREMYLQRPDIARLLDTSSEEKVKALANNSTATKAVIAVADGLSSLAIERHARPFIKQLVPALDNLNLTTTPVFLIHQGRVATGDHIGELLSATMMILLIGERPGLSSPDSMGIYFTYQPKRGLNDSNRNCISNIHQHGLSYDQALHKLLYLITESQKIKQSGVKLKENSSPDQKQIPTKKNFLLD